MKPLCLWLLLLMGTVALAQDRPGDMEAWEPDFAVQFNEHYRSADEPPVQVFTCMLDVADLQFRRRSLDHIENWPCQGDRLAQIADDSLSGDRAAGLLGYRAQYEISLEVRRGKQLLASRYQRFQHETPIFDETMPKDGLRWHHFEVELSPGPCEWWVEFVDLNSRHRQTLHGECKVSEPSRDPWDLAGVWLIQDADTTQPDPLTARPVRFGSLNEQSRDFAVFYELYSRDSLSLRLSTRILDHHKRVRHSRQLERHFPAGLARNLLRIPGGELGSGEYTF